MLTECWIRRIYSYNRLDMSVSRKYDAAVNKIILVFANIQIIRFDMTA